MDADKVLAFCQRHPDIYYLWNKTIFVPFFLCHNPPVLCPSSKCFCLNTKQKMDQFSCFFSSILFHPIQIFLHSELYATAINRHKVLSDRVP